MRRLIFGMGYFMIIAVFSQGALIFESEKHDFGTIASKEDFVEHTFIFSNGGDKPIKLINIESSCGCTTPFWSKEEILPGDSGRITVRYTSANRPGSFSKSLAAKASNGVSHTLVISGNVKPKLNPTRDLANANGSLRTRYKSFNMGHVTTEEPKTKIFDVYNDSDSTLSFFINEFILPDHITIALNPDRLSSKTAGELVISYNSDLKNDLGYLTDTVILKTDDIIIPIKKFNVIATVEEYFPPVSEADMDGSPKLLLEKKLIDLKKVSQGDTVRTAVKLKNTGGGELKIRDVKTNCDCVLSELESDRFGVGEEGKLQLSFLTVGREGTQYKQITIFSNDPSAPTQMITLKATVEE